MGEIVEQAQQPIVTPAEADRVLKMVEAFEYFKSHVLNERDIVKIQDKPYVKKSGWSKYALACNLSTEVRNERVEDRNGSRIYHFTYRAIHLPSGRYAEAVGSASEAEREEWNHPEHDIRTLAQTRAFNRAISNLVGGGEVSAEEMASPKKRLLRKHVDSIEEPDIVDEVEEAIREAGLDPSGFNIYRYGKKIYIEPQTPMPQPLRVKYGQVFSGFNAQYKQLREGGRWEIPLEESN